MYQAGFLKIGLGVPSTYDGDLKHNQEAILKVLNQANASIVLFPELNLVGVETSDLMLQNDFLNQVEAALLEIIEKTTYHGIFTVGLPLSLKNSSLVNAVCIVSDKKIKAVVVKTKHFNERDLRYFSKKRIKSLQTVMIGDFEVPIYEAVRFDAKEVSFLISFDFEYLEKDYLINKDAEILLVPSSDFEYLGAGDLRYNAILAASKRLEGAVIYTSPSKDTSTAKHVYAGDMVAASCGKLLDEATALYDEFDYLEVDLDLNELRYQRRLNLETKDLKLEKIPSVKVKLQKTKDYKFEAIDPIPYLGTGSIDANLEAINNMQVQGLINKLRSLPKHLQKAIIGLSGGADSAHAMLIAKQAITELKLPDNALVLVSMPSENTSESSKQDAIILAKGVNADFRVVPIDEALKVNLKMLNHQAKDVTYENAQARIRTDFLMNLANQIGGIVIGPSDLSEIALGFSTYNGDASSMYGINHSVPKTIILELLRYYATYEFKHIGEVLMRISKKAPSPELIKGQESEKVLGSYLINDFIMYHFLNSDWHEEQFLMTLPVVFELDLKTSKKYLENFKKRFYQSQFKRQVMPDGVSVFKKSLHPASYKLPGDLKK